MARTAAQSRKTSRASSGRSSSRSTTRSKNTKRRSASKKIQKKGKGHAFRRGSNVGGGAVDSTLIVLVGITLLFGLVMLSSASSVQGYQTHGDSYYFLKRQILYGVFLGGIAFYTMSKINYHYWRTYAFPIAVVTVGLLLAVFIPGLGQELLGAKRWIVIGGFSIQPSELVKISFLIYLAAWLEKRGREVEDVHYGFVPFLIMLGALVLFIAIAQKDLGTMIVIGVISVVVYFVAGAPWKHIASLFGGGVAAFLVLVAIAPYRINRVRAFIDPSIDPQGIGYHVSQALLAIGSGGFFGVGLGHSRQKFNYLPEVASDSIFAIIAEEMGFLFAIGVIALFLMITLRALYIAKQAPDVFGKLLAVGIATWIGFQAFVNMGAMLSLMPLTGIPLPFISYGSSSLLTLMAGIGILANISRRIKHV